MSLLTDQSLATGVTLTDLIHIVITGDTSQNPAGSSYKATISQVLDNLTDTSVTGYTYSSNTFTIFENDGSSYSAKIDVMTGLTINGDLSVTGNTKSGPTTASTLNISSTPTTDTSLSANYLTRDGSTGEILVKTIPGPTVYGLFSQTGNSVTVSGTTTETTLIDGGVGTLSVPANGFSVGDSFRADFGGVLNVANNQTIRIRVKAGSIILLDSGNVPITNITSDVWSMSINFTIRQIGGAGVASIVSLGAFHYTKTNNGTVEGFSFNTVNNTTFDTTSSNTLDVTVQWGSNNVSNSIYSDIFVLNKIF